MDPTQIILLIPVILFALSFHEMAHAWVALRMGDTTARDRGRVTLNPLRHLDPLGTLMVFVAGFGWAKPVPVNPQNLRDPLRDGLWIAAAGPGANLLTALASGLLFRILLVGDAPIIPPGASAALLGQLLYLSVTINLMLAVFNLIPLFPLDGSSVLKGLLSRERAAWLARFDAVGPGILLMLILMGRLTGVSPIGFILGPVVSTLRRLVTGGLL
jgi:Zn-dependent protease